MEAEEGDPVERHGGLARARAALDHDQAARRRGDELELRGIDERGDLGEVLVGARHRAGVDAERAVAVLRWPTRCVAWGRPCGLPRGPSGLALTALQRRRGTPFGLEPLALRV